MMVCLFANDNFHQNYSTYEKINDFKKENSALEWS